MWLKWSDDNNHEKYNHLAQLQLKYTKTDTPTLLAMVKYRNKRTNKHVNFNLKKKWDRFTTYKQCPIRFLCLIDRT